MPTNFQQTQFTNAGLDMLGAAEAGGSLIFTKMKAGSGAAAVPADLYPLEDLIAPETDIVITRKLDQGGGKVLVSGVLTEALMPAGPAWQLRELGIMAKIGSGGTERLYNVANVLGDTPDTVTPGGPNTHAFEITLKLDRSLDVTVEVGDATDITAVNIPSDELVGPGVYGGRVGNELQFKRLVEGHGIELDDSSDRITIGQKLVTTNLQLYVPTTHPDAPSADVAFASIQDALDYLKNFSIPTNKTATINVYSGTFNISPITFDHPDSLQIYLLGVPRVEKTVTAIDNVDATHKRVTVTDATGLTVGLRMYLANSAAGWSGACKITGISGLQITVSVEKRDAQASYTTADHLTGRKLSYYPTIITMTDLTGTLSMMDFTRYGIGGITNFTFDAGGGLGALICRQSAVIENVAVWNARFGIQGGDTLILKGEIAVTQCNNGIASGQFVRAWEVSPLAVAIYVSACDIGISGGGDIQIGAPNSAFTTTKVYLAHNVAAIKTVGGTDFYSGGFILASSNDVVGYATFNSTILINPGGCTSTIDNNGTELKAEDRSYIRYNLNGGTTPSCNPAANTLGNQNSLITVA